MSGATRLLICIGAITAVGTATRVPFARSQSGPELVITTDRLSYRLARRGEYYAGRLIVTLANRSRETVYLNTKCSMGRALYVQFAPMDGAQLFLPPGHNEGCAASGVAGRGRWPNESVVAIGPDSVRRDTLQFGATPFAPAGQVAGEGVARFTLRYTPFVRRGFFRREWTIDPHVWLSSDPFELITLGFEQ
jgi:hypothetical protein